MVNLLQSNIIANYLKISWYGLVIFCFNFLVEEALDDLARKAHKT